jgi:hypothetical protein
MSLPTTKRSASLSLCAVSAYNASLIVPELLDRSTISEIQLILMVAANDLI